MELTSLLRAFSFSLFEQSSFAFEDDDGEEEETNATLFFFERRRRLSTSAVVVVAEEDRCFASIFVCVL